MGMQVPFHRHDLDDGFAGAVAQVLKSPFLTSGPVGTAVEAQLAAFFGSPHALLTNSWTNGAVACLLACGIGPGDEVIVPAMTFIATANAVEGVGARPVFADVDPETLLLTPARVAAALTPRTRAVIPVHLYGQMCDMRGIRAVLAGRPEIVLIEDAAHCFEGTRDGDPPGRHADAAIFSFYATKNVTCGEGGAVICHDAELHARMRQTRLHGMSAAAMDRFRNGRYQHWDMERLGIKANLPDLLAALLPPQIATIRARLPRRATLARRYREAFLDGPLRLAGGVPGGESAEHLSPIHVPPAIRDRAIAALNDAGIGVTVNYRPVPMTAYYRARYGHAGADHPVSSAWGGGTISLPLYPKLTEDEQDHVIATVTGPVYRLCRTAD